LGLDFVQEVVFRHCYEIECKMKNHLAMKTFATYEGIEMFHAARGTDFIVFAVEVDDMEDRDVTIMFGGVHGKQAKVGRFLWDGHDYSALICYVIITRAKVWFI
jgi:hypothetical protein